MNIDTTPLNVQLAYARADLDDIAVENSMLLRENRLLRSQQAKLDVLRCKHELQTAELDATFNKLVDSEQLVWKQREQLDRNSDHALKLNNKITQLFDETVRLRTELNVLRDRYAKHKYTIWKEKQHETC